MIPKFVLRRGGIAPKASGLRPIVEIVHKLYGVGPETARILLYPACHQHERLRHVTPWQQKIYSRIFYKKPLVPVRKILSDLNKRYGTFAGLATHYVWEDLFWRHQHKSIPWLAKEIRL